MGRETTLLFGSLVGDHQIIFFTPVKKVRLRQSGKACRIKSRVGLAEGWGLLTEGVRGGREGPVRICRIKARLGPAV